MNGQNAAPVYKFLKSKKPSFLGSRIKWNFTKFLVGKDGQVIDRYGPTVPPLSIEVTLVFYKCILSSLVIYIYIYIHVSERLVNSFMFSAKQKDIKKALGDDGAFPST